MGTFDYCAYTLHFICDEEKKKERKKMWELVTMVPSKVDTNTDGLLALNYPARITCGSAPRLSYLRHTHKKNKPPPKTK